MQIMQSKVNFRKLVRDLADMYRESTFDVVVSELVANALDAQPSTISLDWDDKKRTLIVVDDGDGMDEETFQRYHDFAVDLKRRGDGIGFAGIGAKISFNIADRVVTETRCSGIHNASDWRWGSDGALGWNHVKPVRMKANGTRVFVHFQDGVELSHVDDQYLTRVLKQQYLPLFVNEFLLAYQKMGMYPNRPRFVVNGLRVGTENLDVVGSPSRVKRFPLRTGKKDVGLGALSVSKHDLPINGSTYGVLLCTHGKVIKADLFGQSTGLLGSKLFGIVEMPELVQYLTANKSDLKGGPGRTQGLNRLLDSVREELKIFLAEHGVAAPERERDRLSVKLERTLTRMVKQLPELQNFEGLLREARRRRKNPMGEGLESSIRPSNVGDEPEKVENLDGVNAAKKEKKPSRKRRRSRNGPGPRVAFEQHPERQETAWVDSNTVVINSGHRAYMEQISQDQARLTYCMFAIGVALDKSELAGLQDGESYVDKFIAAWGQS